MNCGVFVRTLVMTSPDNLTICAIIPRAEDPTQLLRDENGDYPSAIRELGDTREQTLHKLTRQAIGLSASVAQRLPGTPDCINYLTKPVSVQPHPDNPYQWR
jgi:hypothetical protein